MQTQSKTKIILNKKNNPDLDCLLSLFRGEQVSADHLAEHCRRYRDHQVDHAQVDTHHLAQNHDHRNRRVNGDQLEHQPLGADSPRSERNVQHHHDPGNEQGLAITDVVHQQQQATNHSIQQVKTNLTHAPLQACKPILPNYLVFGKKTIL